MNTPPERLSFANAAWDAACEIAVEEGFSNVTRLNNFSIDTRINMDGWCSPALWHSHQVGQKLSEVSADWEANGRAILFRGSKMPDVSMGSFGFPDAGVHLTPRLDHAQGYAGSINQDYSQPGQLLKLDDYGMSSLGFISAWEAPLDQGVWRNFAYENFLEDKAKPTEVTLRDTAIELRRISEIAEDGVDYQSYYASPRQLALDEENFRQNHYEVISENGQKPKELYLQKQGEALIKINPENPKWDQWMARIQEANLRHFYEITPLLKIQNAIQHESNAGFYSEEQKMIGSVVLQLSERILEDAKNAPWTCKTMQEARNLSTTMPWITDSTRVGSSIGSSIKGPLLVEQLRDALEAIQVNDIERAGGIVQAIEAHIAGDDPALVNHNRSTFNQTFTNANNGTEKDITPVVLDIKEKPQTTPAPSAGM